MKHIAIFLQSGQPEQIIVGLFALAGVFLGGVITFLVNLVLFNREREWDESKTLKASLEEVSILAEEIRHIYDQLRSA